MACISYIKLKNTEQSLWHCLSRNGEKFHPEGFRGKSISEFTSNSIVKPNEFNQNDNWAASLNWNGSYFYSTSILEYIYSHGISKVGSLQRGWSVYEALTPPPEVTSYIPHLTTPPRSPRGCKIPWVALPTIIVLRWSVNYLTTSTSFLYYNDQKIVSKCNIQQA